MIDIRSVMPTEVGIHVFVVPDYKDVDGGPSPAMTVWYGPAPTATAGAGAASAVMR